ncbi:MAG: DUF2284 domain-containing protein, partial [Oscillospiraceae bacterium]
DPTNMIFEERTKINCFYCGKYNNSWRCPPNLPDIDYKKMFSEYDNGAIIYIALPLVGQDYQEVRTNSSVFLHKTMLEMEKFLWDKNFPMAVSFIGGSCKLCKGGCGKERCNNPYSARSPIEATGVNIIKSAAQYNLDIKFPPSNCMMRAGVLLW